MAVNFRNRRLIMAVFSILIFLFVILTDPTLRSSDSNDLSKGAAVDQQVLSGNDSRLAINALKSLEIKGRAQKTGYSRSEFGSGWETKDNCDTRNIILNRDLSGVTIDDECNVLSGTLDDPYTNKTVNFIRGADTSSEVQIDHVVALGDAWQKGAQQLSKERRIELANDPLELLAVSGDSNQDKGDGDAATWLPPNKSFRCQYVARQIAVKKKYNLWVTQAEFDAINNILNNCSSQMLPNP